MVWWWSGGGSPRYFPLIITILATKGGGMVGLDHNKGSLRQCATLWLILGIDPEMLSTVGVTCINVNFNLAIFTEFAKLKTSPVFRAIRYRSKCSDFYQF